MPLADTLRNVLAALRRTPVHTTDEDAPIKPDDDLNQERAMHVLYHFEKELGSIALHRLTDTSHIPSSIVDEIERKSKQKIDRDNIVDLIEASYLSTLFDLAACAFDLDDKSKGDRIRRLKDICATNNIFDARNAVAHPNKRWYSDYWQSVALLANHRIVVQLNLQRTVEAYGAAVTNRFAPPPETWVRAIEQFEIPNNLNSAYATDEHAKFIGRKQERVQLKKMITKGLSRRISVVAPGGFGKTALVLECFADIAKGYQEDASFSRIMFVSARTESLTYRGVQDVNPGLRHDIELGNQLSQALLGCRRAKWKDAKAEYGCERLLLCIDNVETLNQDARNELVGLMGDEFPDAWTVVATSRVDIENTTAIRLKAMTLSDFKLLTHYFASRHDRHLGEDEAEKLASTVTTPLALKVVFDLFRLGLAPMDAIEQAEQLSAEFAYRKLVESLDDDARKILKVLYAVSDPMTVPMVSQVLEWASERTQAAVVEAGVRSLVEVAEECYVTLQSPVRQFFEDRDEVVDEDLFARWSNLEAQRQITPDVGELELDLGRDFDDVDEVDLKNDLLEIVLSISSQRDRLILDDLNDKVKTLKRRYPSSGAVLRAQSMIAESMRTPAAKIRALETAMRLNGSDWRAGLILAEEYRDRQNFKQSIEICENLLADQGVDGSTPARGRLIEIYYTSRIWRATDTQIANAGVPTSDEFEEIIEETRNWISKDPIHVWATIHATALRRSVERDEGGSERRAQRLVDAFEVYKWLFEHERESAEGRARAELQQLALQFLWLYEGVGGNAYTRNVSEVATFLGIHMDDLLVSPNEKRKKWQFIMRRFHEIDDGVLTSEIADSDWQRWNIQFNRWGRFGTKESFVDAKMYNRHGSKPYLLFARDEDGNQYMIHPNATHCSADKLSVLPMGTSFWIRPGERTEGRSAIPALWAVVR